MSLLILLTGILALLVKKEDCIEILVITLLMALMAFAIETPLVMQLIAWEVL